MRPLPYTDVDDLFHYSATVRNFGGQDKADRVSSLFMSPNGYIVMWQAEA